MDLIRKFRIPAAIAAEADKCRENSGCINNPEFEICKPSYRQGKRVGVLVCGQKPKCPYSSRLGSDYVCTCPVRQEIFKKYGV